MELFKLTIEIYPNPPIRRLMKAVINIELTLLMCSGSIHSEFTLFSFYKMKLFISHLSSTKNACKFHAWMCFIPFFCGKLTSSRETTTFS